MATRWLIGDSHSEGMQGYARAAGWGVVAHRGWSTYSYAKGGGANLPDVTGADVIVVALGSNDGDATALPSSMRTVVGQLREQAPDARIFWVGPPDVTRSDLVPKMARVRATQQDVAGELGVTWVDAVPFTGTGRASDGLHYTIGTGYKAFWRGIDGAAGAAGTTAEPGLVSSSGPAAIIAAVAAVVVLVVALVWLSD